MNIPARLIFPLLLLLCLSIPAAAEDPLAAWQPAFDPGSASYTYLLSCVGHPAIDGVAVGFRIRDKVWERSGGRLYVDFRPLNQLGGEKDVLNKLKFGAVQGMMISSVAAPNIVPTLGLVNLPFLLDTPEKLERFRTTPELFQPFRDAALAQGLLVADFTGYGAYGWATTTPVTSLEQARAVNFRIAEAPVNAEIYKAWDLKFTVMPWADVPQALQTGVIDGLDHTPIVCQLSRKFTVARHFTPLQYAQGLYIHVVNRRWLSTLPEDLSRILLDTIAEESAASRRRTPALEQEAIAAAVTSGVAFHPLPAADLERLRVRGEQVLAAWAPKIGATYLETLRRALATP